MHHDLLALPYQCVPIFFKFISDKFDKMSTMMPEKVLIKIRTPYLKFTLM